METSKATASPPGGPPGPTVSTNASSADTRTHDSLPGEFRGDSDYTFYVQKDSSPAHGYSEYEARLQVPASAREKDSSSAVERRYAYSGSGKIRARTRARHPGGAGDPAGPDDQDVFMEGRMQACRCYRDREIAVTFRPLHKGDGLKGRELPTKRGTWKSSDDELCKYRLAEKPDEPFPVPLETVGERIMNLVFDPKLVGPSPSGLFLVTGATNSAKSELTRTVVYRLLRQQANDRTRKRRPHLLTYEDPIEKWLFQDGAGKATSKMALKRGVEYTPREKGYDVGSLREAVNDALRQTPSIFYVGEVREDEDWEDLMRFAGTGHLVVATAHAGSLIEAMERIFRGAKAKTPAMRGQVAQRVLGVVHQMKFSLQPDEEIKRLDRDGLPGKFEVLLPALWRRTPRGVAALVSDGLASVLPNNPMDEHEASHTSAFGRRYFALAFQKGDWENVLTQQAKAKAKAARAKAAGVTGAGRKAGGERVQALPVKRLVEALRRQYEVRAIRYDLMGV